MKKAWSSIWKKSRQPRKQRKYRANAPLHVVRKFMRARLSKELKQRYKKRNFPVRKGDSVKIMVGNFRGKLGKVENVDLVHRKVYVEGIFREKRDGNKKPLGIESSNLMIMDIDLSDKLRRKALERK